MVGDGAVQWQKLAFCVGLSIALLIKAAESRIPESTLQNLVNHTCSEDTFPPTKAWQTANTAVNQLSANLISAASSQIYSNSSAASGSETVYGAYQCRGDLNSTECNHCVFAASNYASSQCPLAVDARIDLEACSYFYQNTSIAPDFTVYYYYRNGNTTDSDVFIAKRSLVLDEVIDAAPSAPHYYATANDGVVYALAQCFGFLTPQDCAACLLSANQSMETLVPDPGDQDGTRIMLGSCSIRYENYYFFNPTPAPAPSPSMLATPTPIAGPSPSLLAVPTRVAAPGSTISAVPAGETKRRVVIVVLALVIPVVVFVTIVLVYWKKGKRRDKADTGICLQEQHSDEQIELLEKLTGIRFFPLVQLREATTNFHESTELGSGGFGSVYKGTLPDGQAIAIKKIPAPSEFERCSFLTELKTITNVQHPNLIKLIGFCFDCSDKYLIYEFMPQKSLDNHIFEAEPERALTWSTRQKIILGTAKGLQHLHHYSTGRIIHRDIKAANILLDEKLEPKIGDFGLAKLFSYSQTHAVTAKLFQTPGYAPPEYLAEGHITEKYDIYSFGVVLLEILSGRRVFEQPPHRPLVELAWLQHEKKMPLDLMDPQLQGGYEEEEARRLIKLALVCTQTEAELRPTMLKVVAYLEDAMEIIDAPQKPQAGIRRYLKLLENTTDESWPMTASSIDTEHSFTSSSSLLHCRTLPV